MLNKLQFDDKTSKIRAILIYAAVAVTDLILAIKMAGNKSTESIIIFFVIADFVLVYFAGMIFRAPVFGKKTLSMYDFSNYDPHSDAAKAIDAQILSKYYGYSEGESRLIVEQRETNRLLEEQNRKLNDK